MRRVVVDMQNALFADAIATALRNFDSDFQVFLSESPDKTADMCADTQANVLIMEVTAYTPWKIEERMKIRDKVKSYCHDCKIVLVVDENTEKKLADKVRRAKKTDLSTISFTALCLPPICRRLLILSDKTEKNTET